MSSANKWPMVKLGEVLSLPSRWKRKDAKKYSYIDIASLDNNLKKITTTQQISSDSAPSRATTHVIEDDVLVSTVRPNLNAVAMVPTQMAEAIASSGIAVLRAVPDKINPRYLFHVTQSQFFIQRSCDLATGASYPAVSDAKIRSISVPLPPLAEQQRIAEILDASASALSLAQEEELKVDKSRSALFESLFPASNYPGATIRDFLAETQYGSSKKAGTDGKYPVLRMGNITATGSISYSDLKYLDLEEKEINKHTLQNCDILFNRTNSKELVGKTAVYYGEGNQISYAGYLIRCRTNDLATPEFISGFLNSRLGKAQLFQRAKAIVGMANINAQELRTLSIPNVPIEEQEKYTTVYQQLEDLRLVVKKKVVKLKELHNSLSARALTGQL